MNIPTTKENIDETIAFLESELNQDVAMGAKSFLRVLGVLQGTIKTSLYQYTLDRLSAVMARSAQDDDLEYIGENYGIIRKKPTAAILDFYVTGTSGTTLPETTVWLNDNPKLRYFQNQAYTIPAYHVSLCAQNTGTVGNLPLGTWLKIGAPQEGVRSEGVIVGVVSLGTDLEDIEDYRNRVLDAIRTVGGGSNSADIRTWGMEEPGVKQIYPYSGDLRSLSPGSYVINPGLRTIFVEAFSGIADSTLLANVKKRIITDPETGQSRQSLGSIDSYLYVSAMSEVSFLAKIKNLHVRETNKINDCKADITAKVTEYASRIKPFVEGLDAEIDKNNILTAVSLSDEIQNIAAGYGGYIEKVYIENVSTPGQEIGKYELNPGEFCTIGAEYV